MKISRTSWIFIAIGILIIAGTCLGLARSQQTDRQKDLQEKLTLAQKKLASINNEELIAQKERLNLEIKGYQAQTAEVTRQLNFPEDSISVSGLLFKTAGSCKVNITQISSTGRTKADLYGTPCSSLSVNIEVEGCYDKISNFLFALSREFPTSTVSMVQASAAVSASPSSPDSPSPSTPSIMSSPTTASSIPAENEAVRATINLVIYTREIKSNVE